MILKNASKSLEKLKNSHGRESFVSLYIINNDCYSNMRKLMMHKKPLKRCIKKNSMITH